jgi:hypothetical protein
MCRRPADQMVEAPSPEGPSPACKALNWLSASNRLGDTPRMPGEKHAAAGASKSPKPPAPTTRESEPSSGSKMGSPEDGSSQVKSPWWKNSAIVVPSAIGTVGIIVSAFLALHPRAAPEVDNATLCRQQHPDAREVAIDQDAESRHEFAGCVWPPLAGTDSDGYWTVQVQDIEIPGSYAAQKFTTAEVFTTSCFALTLDYVFDSQGTVAHSRFSADTTQTVSGYDGQYVNMYEEVADPPDAVVHAQSTHLIVLINSRYQLQRVRCADSTGAPSS